MNSYLSLIKLDWRLLLFGFVMRFFSSPGQTYFISLFGGEIRLDLSLSHTEFGAVYSAATLVSAILLLWSGPILDRTDMPKFSISIVVLLAFACILISLSRNVFLLFLAILALRQFGQGLMTMTTSSAMVRYASSNKSKAISLSNMGYSLAEAVLPLLVILLLFNFDWRQSWQIIGITILICVPLLIRFSLKYHPEKHQQYIQSLKETSDARTDYLKTKRQWTRKEVIRDPLFYLFMPALITQALILTGFLFHQVHLVEVKSWSLPFWGSLFIIYSITAIVSGLLVASFSDKIGAIKLAPFSGLAGAIGLFTLASSDSQFVAFIFMFCMGVSTGAQSTLFAPFLAERYGNKNFSSIKSIGAFTLVFMSALSPVMIGWLIDIGVSINSLATSFGIYVVCASALAYWAYRLSLKETNH